MVATQHIPIASDPETGWHMWGHPGAVGELQRAIATSPGHAYLFTGPAQSGKRLAAINMAMALCCIGPSVSGRFCGECTACRRISRGVYPDVTTFDLATQAARDRDRSRNLTLNIATVREVSSAIAYRPSEARWRIVIVDDADSMQETAQEAFLKTLEEPPSYAVIVLIATDADRMLETVRSRCREIRFGRSSVESITLALTANGEHEVDAAMIAAHADGSVGWAMEAARDRVLVEKRAALAVEALALITASHYVRMVGAMRLAEAFSTDRPGVQERLRAVERVWHELMLRTMGAGSGTSATLPEQPDFDVTSIPPGDVVRAVKSVETCMTNLEANVRPRMALEVMVGSWPLPEAL